MQNYKLKQSDVLPFPVPVQPNQLDLLMYTLTIPNSQMLMPQQNIYDLPETLMENEKDTQFQATSSSQTKMTKYFQADTKNLLRNQMICQTPMYSKTECKNVLTNIRKPIVEFFKRPKYEKWTKNPVLLKFAKAELVNLNLYQQLFRSLKIKNVLCQMFLSKYLKRAYQQRRTSQANKVIHLHRIRELQKMFIEEHKMNNKLTLSQRLHLA